MTGSVDGEHTVLISVKKCARHRGVRWGWGGGRSTGKPLRMASVTRHWQTKQEERDREIERERV